MNKIVLTLIISTFLTACSDTSKNNPSPDISLNAGVGVVTGTGDFGTIGPKDSKILSVRITNTGDAPLQGPPLIDNNNFSIIYQSGCMSIAPGKKCDLKVNFTGSGKAFQSYSGNLNLDTAFLNLTGVVENPNANAVYSVNFSSNPLNFGTITDGQSLIKTLTLTNSGTSPIENQNITIGSSFILLSDGCSNKIVLANKSCTVRISLNGSGQIGNINQQLTFAGQSVSLIGEVVSRLGNSSLGSPEVKYLINNSESSSYSFGNMLMGSSKQVIVYVKNTGNKALEASVASLGLNSPFSIGFNQCDNKILNPGKSCQIRLIFNTQNKPLGNYSSSLSFGGKSLNLESSIVESLVVVTYSLEYSDFNNCSVSEPCQGVGVETRTALCRKFNDGIPAESVDLSNCESPVLSQSCYSPEGSKFIPVLYGVKEVSCIEGSVVESFENLICDDGYIDVGEDCVLNSYFISLTQPIGGGLSVSSSPVGYNQSATINYVPPQGFEVLSWTNDCQNIGVGNSCILNNITSDKTVSVVVGCKSGYNLVGNNCVPDLAISQGTCSSSPLLAYAPCNVSVTGGVGFVVLSADRGSINSLTKEYIPNCLNNSGLATITATDSENNSVSLNLSVTCVYSGCSEIKAKGYALTGGNFWVDMDGFASPNAINVYCDISNSSYTEVFDLLREPSLTSSDVLSRLNKFSNVSLSSSQVIKDSNGVVWKNSSGIEGLSYSLNKYSLGGVKIRVNKVSEANANQGAFSLHSINKTGCSSTWSAAGSSCTSNLLKGTFQPSLNVFNYADGTVGNANWSFDNLLGSTVYSTAQNLEHILTDIPSSGVHFTTYGRTEGSAFNQSLFHVTQLKFKDIYFHHPTSCANAKVRGDLNLNNSTGSGIYILDDDGFELKNPPVNVFCDMSGSGVATLTASCLDAKRFGQLNSTSSLTSGYFSLDLDGVGSGGSSTSSIYCDQQSLGGGWALISNSSQSNGSYPATLGLSFASNFDLQPLFPSSINTSNKMVKVRNSVMREYSYSSTNTFRSVNDTSKTLNGNGTVSGVTYVWNLSDNYSVVYPVLGNPTSGGSWCDGSNGFALWMNRVGNPGAGIFVGSNAYQGGCNSNNFYSVDFNWQVFSR